MRVLLALAPLSLAACAPEAADLDGEAIARAPKIDVCHYDAETGGYNLISVSANSAHLTNHADDYLSNGEDAVAVYRLHAGPNGDHLYTTSSDERDILLGAGWTDEGILGYGFEGGGADLSPVYRVFNSVSGDHLYTMGEAERDFLVGAGWTDEGIGWYAFAFQAGGTDEVYRVWRAIDDHFYTMNQAEKDFLVSIGDSDEGVMGYMFADAVTCD